MKYVRPHKTKKKKNSSRKERNDRSQMCPKHVCCALTTQTGLLREQCFRETNLRKI